MRPKLSDCSCVFCQNLKSKGLVLKTAHQSSWRCFAALVSYSCNIYAAKNMSTVLNGNSVSQPCVSYQCLDDNISHLWICEAREVLQTMAAGLYAEKKIKVAARQNARVNQSDHEMLLKQETQLLKSLILLCREPFLEGGEPVY